MSSPLVYCIILNLNGKELLLETVASVRQMTYPNFRIIVADNGSSDGSPNAVRAQHPETILLENGKNLGFGEGNNVGMRHALAHGADWVFLLNNDILVDPALLTQLMNIASADASIGILGPKIYYQAQPQTFWYAGGRINFFTGVTSHRGIRETDRGQYDRVEDTDYITGCAMLMRLRFWSGWACSIRFIIPFIPKTPICRCACNAPAIAWCMCRKPKCGTKFPRSAAAA
jgi:hypothetical protein